MNTTYLNTEKIKQIAEKCDTVLSTANKSKLKALSEKYNVVFAGNKQNNLNLF